MTMQQGSDLGAQPNTPISPPGTGEPQTTPAATGSGIPSGPINLFGLEEFRQYQSQTDQRFAQERNARLAAERRAAEAEAQNQQNELARLDTLDPEEQVRVLRRQLSQKTKADEEQRINQQYAQQAYEMLAAAGLTWQDPRIQHVVPLGPTPQMITALSMVLVQIARQDADAAKLAAQVQAQKQAEAARTQTQITETRAAQAALADAGVTLTSGAAPSAVAPRDERADMIAGFKARKRSLIQLGKTAQTPEFRSLVNDLRAKGLTLADV